MKRLLSGLLATVLATGVVDAAIVDIRWDAQQRFTHRAQVAPGKFVELCGALRAGTQVNWRFEAGAPLNFNVHYHVSKDDVVYPARLNQTTRAADTLTVTVPQDYCWMWTNKGEQPVALDVVLERR